MKNIFTALFISMFCSFQAQQFKAYQFYDKKGKSVKPEKLIRQLADYDVVFFGENHNNSINHWLQLKVTEGLYTQKNGQLILGAEMLERDNQPQLNQYLNGKID